MNKGVKFSGHTMGAPGRDIYECIKLFSEIGYDGIEVRVHPTGQIDSETVTEAELAKILAFAKSNNIEFSCLTSYYQNYVNPEKRDSEIAKSKRVAEVAAALECPMMRLYGGVEPFSEQGIWFADVWSRTVSGIREVAQHANKLGVKICIETHIGSLTMSVRDTVRLIEDVNMPNVGMLFDYAWVEMGGVESGAEAVKAASKYLYHCHVKDWKLESRIPLKKQSCLMGEGTVKWTEVLPALKEIGYSGYISDEYEKLWYPADLPEPEIGMKHNLEFCKKFMLG